jgi:hypothetical protein
VRCSVVSVIAVWRLVIIFSLSVVLALEFGNSACSDVELSSLLLYGMIICSLAVKVWERNLCIFYFVVWFLKLLFIIFGTPEMSLDMMVHQVLESKS